MRDYWWGCDTATAATALRHVEEYESRLEKMCIWLPVLQLGVYEHVVKELLQHHDSVNVTKSYFTWVQILLQKKKATQFWPQINRKKINAAISNNRHVYFCCEYLPLMGDEDN